MVYCACRTPWNEGLPRVATAAELNEQRAQFLGPEQQLRFRAAQKANLIPKLERQIEEYKLALAQMEKRLEELKEEPSE